MKGFRRIFFLFVTVLLFLMGCGGSTPQITTEVDLELDGNSNQFIDWDKEDWKFIHPFTPVLYPESSRFNNLKYNTPYEDFTHYRAQYERMSLEEFRKLPQATQNKRRLAAERTLHDALVFHRIMIWSWEIWVRSLKVQVAREAWFYQYGVITPAIMNLEKAAAEDPGNPFVWSHLAFFTGLVGNNNRQIEVLNNAFNALEDYRIHQPELSSEKLKELHMMSLRWSLDLAWVLRESARLDEGMSSVDQALAMMAGDDFRTPELAREGLLLQALLLVDQGHHAEARQKANHFKKWSLPIVGGGRPPMTKHNYGHMDSDFCRQWVWDMTHMKQGNRSRALRPPGYVAGFLEYPPHLGYRFWQDMGRIREHFGERGKAWTFYFKGFMCRPFLSFYPTAITMGYTPVFGQEETGNFHFLGYRDFYLGGSEFAYAANRVAAMERSFGKKQKNHFGLQAIDALTVCRKKGIRPLSSLALRGYAHTLLDQNTLAEHDLHEADRELKAAGREDPQVIRLLATLHYNRQDYQHSHELLARYLNLKPDDAASWRFDGVILAEMGRYNKGLIALDTALEIEPESIPGLYNHALVQLHRGEVLKAQADLQKAGLLSPGNNAIHHLAQLIRNDPETKVQFQHQPQKWSISSTDSSGFLDENPAAGLSGNELQILVQNLEDEYSRKPSQESRLKLAYAFSEARQWEKTQALMTPSWPDNINLEGSLLLLQADRALGYADRAVELAESLNSQPGLIADPRLWTLVAVVCHESGKLDSGNQALELALQLDPENRALMMMREQLIHQRVQETSQQ